MPCQAHAVHQAGPRQMLELESYILPTWANALSDHAPKQRYALGIFPTPIHRWHPPGVPDGVEMYIKRDDLSGMQLSGNKVRKLEFLMAEVVAQGHDCVITIGGIQSNHCRATAVAARYLGLDSHLILRTSRELADSDPGLTGNLLLARMVGAHIHTVTKEEYTKVGSEALLQQLADQLRSQGKKPYCIPVGGSSPLGCWGYLEAVREIQEQAGDLGITDIAMACGSGGTAAGMALGIQLSGLGCKLHAMGVCDDPQYFYDYIDGLLKGMGVDKDTVGVDTKAMLRMVQAKGAGYAMSKQQELETMQHVAHSTGVILDPVYSGKACYTLLEEMKQHEEEWKGRKDEGITVRKAYGLPCLMATAQKRCGRGCEPCQGFVVLALVVLIQLACAEGRGPAASLVRSARPRQLQAGASSADGWMQGRAIYFGPPASFNDTFVESPFQPAPDGDCGYYSGASLYDNSAITVPASMLAALASSNPDYPGSCGRCYELRCQTGVVAGNYSSGNTLVPYAIAPSELKPVYQFQTVSNEPPADSFGRIFPGNVLNSSQVLYTDCWNTTDSLGQTSADNTIIVQVTCACSPTSGPATAAPT
ncbi:hypothetical protein WJX77_012639 [Trebouxia sp. C0004]